MGKDLFDDFRFPEPVELRPLPDYEGVGGNFGGYEEAHGGEQGNEPRLLIEGVEYDEKGDLRAFRAYDVTDTAGTWWCYVTAGIAIANHIRHMGIESGDSSGDWGDAVRWYIPTIEFEGEDVDIVDPQCSSGEPWVRPKLGLPSPPTRAYIYCIFRTDNHGVIIPWDDSAGAIDAKTVFIEAHDVEVFSENHMPPSPTHPEGREGEYYWLLSEICMDSSGGVAHVVHRHQSNILWPGEFELNNDSDGSSDGSRIYRTFNRTTGDFMLRKIRGCYGLKDDEAKKYIDLDFQGENVGSAGVSVYSTMAEVYVDSSGRESCGAKAQYRRITSNEVVFDPQIFPVQSGQRVEMRGNGFNALYAFDDCKGTINYIQVIDGLVAGVATGGISDVVFTHRGRCDSSGEETETPSP